ncbi:MAG: hypothetical protein ACI865_001480 [Flavobacteriaceae bacterium]|jgi:hypothetical protein
MLKKTVSIVSLSLLVLSCGESAESIEGSIEGEVDELVDEMQDEISPSEDVETEMSEYEKGWEAFKMAVTNGDNAGISSMTRSKDVDVGMLMLVLSPKMLDQLKATSFRDLIATDANGTDQLEFHAEETGIDEDGNEIGSAIMIYFSKGDNKLVLDDFIAAG